MGSPLRSPKNSWCTSIGQPKIKVLMDIGYGKIQNPAILRNTAKSGSGQTSSRIWRMPVQLQYVQLITSPTRDSGGAEYCDWFVLATM